MYTPTKGFTLLIAVVLASVSLAIGIALLDVALKQVILASSARQSQIAFYNADAALEHALYWDQQQDAFNYSSALSTITCRNLSISVTADNSATPRRRTFTVPCSGGGGTVAGNVIITKESDASTGIYATGYNTCDPDNPRRIERGLRATY